MKFHQNERHLHNGNNEFSQTIDALGRIDETVGPTIAEVKLALRFFPAHGFFTILIYMPFLIRAFVDDQHNLIRLKIVVRIRCIRFFVIICRTFASAIHRRNFSSSENQTTASSEEATELEKKLQSEVDSLTGQVSKLTEKSDELLVSGVVKSRVKYYGTYQLIFASLTLTGQIQAFTCRWRKFTDSTHKADSRCKSIWHSVVL